LKKDKDIILQALKNSESLIKNIPTNLKHDYDFIVKLTQHNYRIYYYLANQFKNDYNFIKKVYSKNKKIHTILSEPFYSQFKDYINFSNFLDSTSKHDFFNVIDMTEYIKTFLF
jgi:hypothetical protein